MSFPDSLTTRIVEGRFVTYPDGLAAKGKARITLLRPMQGPGAGAIVASFTMEITFTDGDFAVELPATNDPAWTTSEYLLVVEISGKEQIRAKFQVPYNGSGPVKLAEVLNLPPATSPQAYILSASRGVPGGVATLGQDGYVLPSQVPPVAVGSVEWDAVLNKPDTFPAEPQSVTWNSVGDKPTTFPPTTHSHAFVDVTGKPATYPPASHEHTFASITEKPSTYPHDPIEWDDIQNKPTTFPGAGGGESGPVEWNDVLNKPSVFPATPDSWSTVTGKPSTFPPDAHQHAYSSLTGIPATFVPAAHAHAIADVTALDEALSSKASTVHTHAYSSLTGIPSTFAPSAHNHAWTDVTGKPTTFAPSAHNHAWDEVTGKPTTFEPAAHTHAYSTLTGIPSTFTPATHAHAISDVTNLQTTLDGKAATTHTHAWGDVTGKPTTFAPDLTDIQSMRLENQESAPANPTNGVVAFAMNNALLVKAPSGDIVELGVTDWPDITNKPIDYPPSDHFHDAGDITGLATVATTGNYNDLTNKPVGGGGGSSAWADITSKPDYLRERNTPLRQWYAALANRHYAPAKIVVIGDSLSEGIGASQFGRGWVPMMIGQLRSRFPTSGVVGGQGFVASWDNPGYGGGAPSYTYPVAQNAGFYSNTQGFALKSNTLLATGDQMTYTFTGTSVHVWYIIQPTGGTFSVTIDGVVVQASVVTAGTLGRGVWTSAALTSGTHTIQVTRISGGGASSILFNGFRIFDGDESKGIQVFNCAQSGLTSGQFATDASNGDKWATWLEVIEPQLVIIELGLNDWTGSISMATLKTNLKSIITTIRARTTLDPSIVIYAATQANNGSYASTYAQLHTVWEEVVAEEPQAALFDVHARITPPHIDNTDGLYYDMLHPSDKGHAAIADRITSFLSPQ